jgi:hypothetical protein
MPQLHSFLKALPVELAFPRDRIAIVSVKGRSLSPLAKLFIERVRAITRPLAKK